MPDLVSPSPALHVYQDDAGTVSVNLALPAASVNSVIGINWPAILQAIVAALPSILAIISAFSSTKVPVAHDEVKP